MPILATCSPRPRGWSRHPEHHPPRQLVLPAPAGMVPATRSRTRSPWRAPRARGDGPSPVPPANTSCHHPSTPTRSPLDSGRTPQLRCPRRTADHTVRGLPLLGSPLGLGPVQGSRLCGRGLTTQLRAGRVDRDSSRPGEPPTRSLPEVSHRELQSGHSRRSRGAARVVAGTVDRFRGWQAGGRCPLCDRPLIPESLRIGASNLLHADFRTIGVSWPAALAARSWRAMRSAAAWEASASRRRWARAVSSGFGPPSGSGSGSGETRRLSSRIAQVCRSTASEMAGSARRAGVTAWWAASARW